MVIVDGNNVMGQRVGWHRDKSAARRRLIGEVRQLAQSQGEPHILVFDAGSKSEAADTRTTSFLTVRYAPPRSTADELILELAYRQMQHSELTVVTSDRALARQVQILGARVLRSGAFRKTLSPLS
jgi:predicted RNA-binding protein with PIN domain